MSEDPKPGSGSGSGSAERTVPASIVDIREDSGVVYRLVLPHADRDWIQQQLRDTGRPYEQEMLRDMACRLQPADLVVDVGANIGNHTLYLAAVAEVSVVAFEPNRELAAAIRDSVDHNGLGDRVSVEPVALGRSEGKGILLEDCPENLGAQRVVEGEGAIAIFPLSAFSFDRRVAALKIDVEGMEAAVIEGARTLIEWDRPLLYVECSREDDFRAVYSLIESLGYYYTETFNATPTHLFRHASEFPQASQRQRILYQIARTEYYTRARTRDLEQRLDNANVKYREVTERVRALQREIAEAEEAHRRLSDECAALRHEVTASRHRESAARATSRRLERALAGARDWAETLHQERDAARAARDAVEQSLQTAHIEDKARWHEQLTEAQEAYRRLEEGTVTPLKKENAKQQAQLQARQEKITELSQQLARAERRVASLVQSRTYRLGCSLREALTSWRGFLRLPFALWRIYRGRPATSARGIPTPAARPTAEAAARSTGDDGSPQAVAPLPPPTSALRERLAHVAPAQLRVACVFDDFSYAAFAPECNLFALTPQQWRNELEAAAPDLLLIESAWRGSEGLWGDRVGHLGDELRGIVSWCRERGIPTAFWNKEDPVHFTTFLNTARLFDYVFTTDIDSIHRYQSILGHDRVYLLPFACQPGTQNPIEIYDRKDAICFAGAHYTQYSERIRDFQELVAELPLFRPLEIYDRNYGTEDERYAFPAEFQPHIRGKLAITEIDRAYKGYRYALNLNSIKQSQSMFARRVFELLACGTLTVSNFSRGLRLLFGDLVIATDSGAEMRRRLQDRSATACEQRLRVAGIRKVLLEHTYGDRLRTILSKMTERALPPPLPRFCLLGRATSRADLQRLLGHVRRQNHVAARLIVVPAPGLTDTDGQAATAAVDCTVTLLESSARQMASLRDRLASDEWLATVLPDDYYGPNYLLDIALATRYSAATVIGKAAHYVGFEGDAKPHLRDAADAYQWVSALPARRCAVAAPELPAVTVAQWLSDIETRQIAGVQTLAIDPLNYCAEADRLDAGLEQVSAEVDDSALDTGVNLAQLQEHATAADPASAAAPSVRCLDAPNWVRLLRGQQFQVSDPAEDGLAPGATGDVRLSRNTALRTTLVARGLEIESHLGDRNHDYIYAPDAIALAELREMAGTAGLALHMEMEPGLNARLVVLFLDRERNRLGHVIEPANRNHDLDPPAATVYVRLGLRIHGNGRCCIRCLWLGRRDLSPPRLFGRFDTLLVTNNYPTYQDLYRNAFVHSRVRAYRQAGLGVDVFHFREEEVVAWHEFENVDVTTGSAQALRRQLATGRYRHILVHFLTPAMWDVLRTVIDSTRVTVWLHGAEVQAWHRRRAAFDTDARLAAAKRASDARLTFWRDLLHPMPPNLQLVFVSQTLADEVMADCGMTLPEDQYRVIPNPIDTDLFTFEPKPPEQRKKIISIRPYRSPIYANDLAVDAVRALAAEPLFDELTFHFVGDGDYFEETLAPLRGLTNVTIERRFLTQPEIAALHKDYGVFLCPSRGDTQGVSRDEAMASGLVPVTHRVGAIPEFVDDRCAMLAAPESSTELAAAIRELACDPQRFTALSAAAAARVRTQRAHHTTIAQELEWIGRAGGVGRSAETR